MDALKLKMRAKDSLHPLLSELMSSYSRFKASSEWEGRPKILHWCVELSAVLAISVTNALPLWQAHYPQSDESK